MLRSKRFAPLEIIGATAPSTSNNLVTCYQIPAQLSFTPKTTHSELTNLSTTPSETVIKKSFREVVRVLSPTQFVNTINNFGTHYFSIGGYPSFDAYVKSVRAARKKTSIQGKLGPGNFNFVSEVNDALDIVTTETTVPGLPVP